jgi:hypothetical protein
LSIINRSQLLTGIQVRSIPSKHIFFRVNNNTSQAAFF